MERSEFFPFPPHDGATTLHTKNSEGNQTDILSAYLHSPVVKMSKRWILWTSDRFFISDFSS